MLTLLAFITLLFVSFQGDPYKAQREQMVKYQIEARGVKDKATLQSMRNVKRHLFVPENSKDDAYDDGPMPIGYGQTISQPYIVAFMTEIINPKPDYKILEIGTGSGYQAAVLAEIVKNVYTIEIITQLSNSSKERLRKLGYKNIAVMNADGYYGWKEHAPFDAIVVTAAAEYIPPPLIEQLKEGGKMVIPVGSPFYTQTLMLVEKKDGDIITKNMLPVRFVPLTRAK
jgi:protein-L-isoaspartate(D-aspartate) O-methyltransferase